MRRLDQGQPRAYCGANLHARTMFLCVLDYDGRTLFHQDIPATKSAFLEAIAPHRDGLVVACECMFAWYWLADACQEEGIPFVLGHALDMRAIQGTKAKNDKIDSEKIAHLLRTGLLHQDYVYPAQMRATRDLLRRRGHLVRRRTEALTHVQIIHGHYTPLAGGGDGGVAGPEPIAELCRLHPRHDSAPAPGQDRPEEQEREPRVGATVEGGGEPGEPLAWAGVECEDVIGGRLRSGVRLVW